MQQAVQAPAVHIGAIELGVRHARSLRDKMKALSAIDDDLLNENSLQVLNLLEGPIHMARTADNRKSLALILSLRAKCLNLQARTEEAICDLSEALTIYRELGDLNAEGRVTVLLGTVYGKRDDLQKQFECIEDSIAIFEELGQEKELVTAYQEAVRYYAVMRDFPSALVYGEKALALLSHLDMPRHLANIYRSTARVYEQAKNYERALNLYQASIDLFQDCGDRFNVAIATMQQAVCRAGWQWERGVQVESDKLAARTIYALEVFRACGAEESVPNALYYTGMIYSWGKRHSLALKYLRECEIWFGERDFVSVTCLSALRQIGVVHLERHKYQQAIRYLERALTLGGKLDVHNANYVVGNYLSQAYESLGQIDKAFEVYRNYIAAKEQIEGENRRKEMRALHVCYEVRKAQQEKEVLRLQNEKLKQEMAHKQREMTTLALHLSQKNSLLDSLNERIKSARASLKDDTSTLLSELLGLVQDAQQSELELEAFDRQFQIVHGDFVAKLARDYPTLSSIERRVCYFVKINMATKEIARLLCTSVRSIETYRYRLRKKLDLPRYTSLSQFLDSL